MNRKGYFKNKRIWITGASSGIGQACAIEISRHEPQALILSGRNIERLNSVKDKLETKSVLLLPFDVTDKVAYPDCVQKIEKFCNGLDVAFFNAGGSEHFSVKEFNSERFERLIALNYYSLIYGVEAVLPLLRKSKGGHLVGMSSVASFLGIPEAEGYCAAKAAARIFLEGLRAELHHQKIKVTTICPGFVKTPMVSKNDFKMPFLLEADKAAQIIAEAIARQKQEFVFPLRMRWLIRLLRSLPKSWQTRIMADVRR